MSDLPQYQQHQHKFLVRGIILSERYKSEKDASGRIAVVVDSFVREYMHQMGRLPDYADYKRYLDFAVRAELLIAEIKEARACGNHERALVKERVLMEL